MINNATSWVSNKPCVSGIVLISNISFFSSGLQKGGEVRVFMQFETMMASPWEGPLDAQQDFNGVEFNIIHKGFL